MPTGTSWSEDRYCYALIAAHSRWRREESENGAAANSSRRAFCVRYLRDIGLAAPTYRFRHEKRFDAILARCPPEVQRDFQVLAVQEWTPESISTALRELFELWLAARRSGATKLRWCPSFLGTMKRGSRLLRSLSYARVPVEVYLARIGGPIVDEWFHKRQRWTRDELRDEFRRAHRTWLAEGANGKPAGRRFNVLYLTIRARPLLQAIEKHVRGGVQAFVRTLPEVYRDWSCRTFRSDAEIRDELFKLHYAWLRAENGRAAGFPFGAGYLRCIGRKDLASAMKRRRPRRIFRGHENAPAARAWGKFVPGMYRRELRMLRQRMRRRLVFVPEQSHG